MVGKKQWYSCQFLGFVAFRIIRFLFCFQNACSFCFLQTVNITTLRIRPPDHLGSARWNQGQLPRGCGAFSPRFGVAVFPKQLVFDSFRKEKCNCIIFSEFRFINFRGICVFFFLGCSGFARNVVSTREQKPCFSGSFFFLLSRLRNSLACSCCRKPV